MTPQAGPSLCFVLDEASRAGEARRVAKSLAGQIGFDEEGAARVALVVTELATNLIKHAREGMLLLRPIDRATSRGLEVLSIDRGPGMADLARCMADGYSTAGSPGNGLGAVARLSALVDIHTAPGSGTVTLAILRPEGRDAGAGEQERERDREMTLGVVSLPYPGEEVCGDSWAFERRPGETAIAVVDGLGHGLHAAEAAREAVARFRADPWRGPASILRDGHEALRHTRGAAMAIASIDHERGELKYAGVGNIAGSISPPHDERRANLVSSNGIVGHSLRKVQEFAHTWTPGSVLVMHSDGISTQWDLRRSPGLATRHPAVIAGVLARDYRRERDDATVVVASGSGEGGR